MKNKTERVSLLSYLRPEPGSFYLELTHKSGWPNDGRPSPFVPLVESDPLSRVMQGRIVTDAGTTIKDVLLLVQKDAYGFVDDSLCPFFNPDVERAWQDAFSFYLKGGKELLLFSKQMRQAGGLARMDPLFFCDRTGQFFPPLCPVCGLPLEQCEDDGLLALIGLKPYTRSLKRYLFCEACTNQDRLRFYIYETDGTEPGGVENRFGLIKRFESLLHSAEGMADFPCRTCQFQDQCYGTEQKVVSTVTPFAFYPFHMLILSGPTLNIWNGEQKEEKEDLLGAREHALRLGWSLVTSLGKGENEGLSTTGIGQRLETLRKGVIEDVALADASTVSAPSIAEYGEAPKGGISAETATNDEIGKLLAEIRKDWQNRVSEAARPPLAEIGPEDDTDMEESVETVFLSLSDLDQIVPPPPPPKEEDITPETVLQPPSREESPEDAEKTVILSAAPAPKQIDFEKTVILNVGATAEASAPVAGTMDVQTKMPETAQEVQIEETVIISADCRPAGPGTGAVEVPTEFPAGTVQGEPHTKQPALQDEGDLLEETVILRVDDRPKTRGNR